MKLKLAFILLFLFSPLSIADTIIEIEPAPEKGFSLPFLLKIPSETKAKYLVVETNNTGRVSDNFEDHYEHAKKAILGNSIGPWVSKKLNAPILMPVFPRSKKDWEIYTHALDRDTLLVKQGKLERVDLQLLAMVREAKDVLEKNSVTVNEKIILTGFSASGTLANRFSFLHPEAIKLVVAGGLNGILMLPIASLNDKELNYPLGINDFEHLTGIPFNQSEWNSVPQFLFMGENDTNDAVEFSDGYSEEERKTIYSAMGKEMLPKRWMQCQQVYNNLKTNVVFTTYKDVGHGTNLKIRNDIFAFINENI